MKSRKGGILERLFFLENEAPDPQADAPSWAHEAAEGFEGPSIHGFCRGEQQRYEVNNLYKSTTVSGERGAGRVVRQWWRDGGAGAKCYSTRANACRLGEFG